MVEVVEVNAAPGRPVALEGPVIEPSLSATTVQPLINLEEELMATDVEEETEAAANPSIV